MHDETHPNRSEHRTHMPPGTREKVARRLALIEGQVRGLNRMVSDDRYCPEILDQVEAVREALRQVGRNVLRNYLDQCVTDSVIRGDLHIYDELMAIVDRYQR